MKVISISWLTLLLFCIGCQKSAEKIPPFIWEEFNGRDEVITYNQTVRRPVYHAKVPLTWKRIDPSDKESLCDTTKPIVTFKLDEGVLLTVHSFPTDSLEQRVPAAAQVERWSGQLKGEAFQIAQVAHGGFVGLYFEGKNGETTLCAWALQLDLDHYQHLHFLTSTVEEEEHYKQMAADYTIKVIGPTPLVDKHLQEMKLFADSFELIQEIPARL